jgi:predicted phosphodiesterase
MTRYALISDVHGNFVALERNLYDILFVQKIGPSEIRCLGDIVGYYPWANECVERLKKLKIPTVKGNHDHASADPDFDITKFNDIARAAIEFTRSSLTEEHKEDLSLLPYIYQGDSFQWVHANPIPPYEDFKYIEETRGNGSVNPTDVFEVMEGNVLFTAHTHQPRIFKEDKSDFRSFKIIGAGDELYRLEPDRKHIIDIGSIGQPRDNQSMSCYVIYDDRENTVQYIRLEYNIRAVQETVMQMDYAKTPLEKNRKAGDVVCQTVGDYLSQRLVAGV